MPARRSDEAKLWKDKDIFWKAAVITAGAKCWSDGADGMLKRGAAKGERQPVSQGGGLAGRRRLPWVGGGGWQEGDGSCRLEMAAGRKETLPVSYEWRLAGRRRFLSATNGGWQE